MRRQAGYPLRQGITGPLVMDRRNPQRGTTTTDPRLVTESRGLRFVIELQFGGAHADMFVSDGEVVVSAGDGSWATAALTATAKGVHAVAQVGPRRLWDSVEAAVATWQYLGKPALNAFGVTATSDVGDQRVWVENPQSAYSWRCRFDPGEGAQGSAACRGTGRGREGVVGALVGGDLRGASPRICRAASPTRTVRSDQPCRRARTMKWGRQRSPTSQPNSSTARMRGPTSPYGADPVRAPAPEQGTAAVGGQCR